MSEIYVPFPVEELEEAGEQPTYTYKLDLDAGRIVGFVDGLEAVNQAIRKAIITPRFKCLIYDDQYGSEIEDTFIAQDATRAYIEAATEGFVRDCLKPDTRIINVYDFSFEYEKDAAYICFKASTIFGDTEIREAV